MKNTLDRNWLEQYKTNPRGNNILYKNYYNPNTMAVPQISAESTNKGVSEGYFEGMNEARQSMLNSIPEELRNLPQDELLAAISHRADYNNKHPKLMTQMEGTYKGYNNTANDLEKMITDYNELKASHENSMNKQYADAAKIPQTDWSWIEWQNNQAKGVIEGKLFQIKHAQKQLEQIRNSYPQQ